MRPFPQPDAFRTADLSLLADSHLDFNTIVAGMTVRPPKTTQPRAPGGPGGQVIRTVRPVIVTESAGSTPMNQSELETRTIDRDTFRSVMRRQAASVTIITTRHDDALHGMTATAFTSVCADPPTILIVVNRSARSHPLIDGSGIFAVNILAEPQLGLATRFSGKLDDQFDSVSHEIGLTGAPILAGSSAHLECVVVQRIEVETHTLFVGRVLAGSTSPAEPLIYHEGTYSGLRPIG